ncbi:glycoside hydrolase family 43 protein [Myriangium duriaei CBS 260.36]|uniref:Glycoside hydrolase family 43 protein n=1 Tax=Myriangium duriaei CBS 260.36 TaxID=1168546 RepID=A0A9P4J4I3_9PEZI|nr:glycoside hydrolase family 43 protein [Myriangium duriaei CBS 260.36]
MGNNSYTNPILQSYGADPFVIQYNGQYLMTYTTNDNITLLRSSSLTDWNNAEVKSVFTPPPGLNYSTDLWAPEIHNLDGKWYFIFTADPNGDSPPPQTSMYCDFDCPAVNHRMYVLESSGADPWDSTYTFKSQLDTYDQFAIDGTYFQHSTGLYHIYSCWQRAYDGWPANLCITKMSNPWTVESNLTQRTILSVPSNPWEQTPYGRPATMNTQRLSSNEGPQQLTNPETGQNFVIYSAARSDNPNYCLGQLELVGADPMNNQDWVKRDAGCVFYQNKLEDAYGVGHASFVKSPDGSEEWIVYHGMRNAWNGWTARTIRAQKFGWNSDGSPSFPRPGYGPYPVPAGQS